MSVAMAKLKIEMATKDPDPREMPSYGIPQAARYLRIPPATLTYWVKGKAYRTESGQRFAQPVIVLPDPDKPLLSFFNLVEAHILRALRKEQKIKLQHIRAAIDFVSAEFGGPHPLIQDRFKTDGARLFVDKLGKLVDVSGVRQRVMPEVMEHLERLEFADRVVARLYPFTRRNDSGPKTVFFDPRYSFGRLVVDRIFVPTSVIGDRYEAGESIDDLARDYGCEKLEIEEAIRCELSAKAA
jgi:uncharacterized protein (DUF433 family)